METIGDFVNQLKKRYDISSDYGLAKILGLTRQTMSAHKSGRAKHFSQETAYRLAELLDVDPAYVMTCLEAERAKDDRVREAWQRVGKMMRVGAIALIVSFFVPSQPAEASSFSISHNVTDYTLCARLRKWLTCFRDMFWGKLNPC